jgi:hypothetical protein
MERLFYGIRTSILPGLALQRNRIIDQISYPKS